MSTKNFDELLLEAVDEGLSAVGESSKQAIYFHLEKAFNLERQEIPNKIEVFAYGVEKIFGLGANFLEILIMKRLYEKLGRKVQVNVSKDFTFAAYVAAVKQSFIEKEKVKEPVQCDQTVIQG
jgi:hypothetical protein